MKCNNCGAENNENSRFCRRCGNSLQINSTPQKPPKDNVSKVIVILIIIIVLAILAVVGYFLISMNVFGSSSDRHENKINNQTFVSSEEAEDESTSGDSDDSDVETEAATESMVDETKKNETISAQIEVPTQKIKNATYFSNASASSVLPDMDKHNYSASNALKNDGTCWCEGADGYGIDEWIKFELPETQLVSGIKIKNGYAGTEKQYNDNSKPLDILIEFSNGQTTPTTLSALDVKQRSSLQKVTFSSPVETDYVKIVIKSTSKADCEDTCITYVEPF